MTEIYAKPRVSTEVAVDSQPDLHVVPVNTIVAAEVDDAGRVTRPAIDIATGRMPNGQRIETFYDRDTRRMHAYRLAANALAAARREVY